MGTYCDPEDVADFLQITGGFSSTTNPTSDTVERVIESIEDIIDARTKHAWRERRIVDEYKAPRWDTAFRLALPVPYVDLDHWQVFPLATASGDKLEVFDGSSYVEWLAGGKVHGRTADYFLEERRGRLLFPRGFPFIRRY